ncbi:MAG: IS3 family transposase, partial [Fusobacteriaceae bacterium]
ITYIWVGNRWEYLSTIIDLYSRKVLANILGSKMDSKLVEDTFKLAHKRRSPEKGLIFHSDKGSQYRSKNFKKLLKDSGVIQSMCGKGNCYENAAMESFHATLKLEMVYVKKIRDRETMRLELFKFIDGFYNRKRLHSSLGSISPEEFEQN